jgi:hypothetical protein
MRRLTARHTLAGFGSESKVVHNRIVPDEYDTLVPPVGFEPTYLSAMVFETIMYSVPSQGPYATSAS